MPEQLADLDAAIYYSAGRIAKLNNEVALEVRHLQELQAERRRQLIKPPQPKEAPAP